MQNANLYVVATPIGNMEDITFRAIKTLKEVDFIICEDTRVTSKLLNKYEFKKELVSFNARFEERKIPKIIDRLVGGEFAALVSDAGTPGISDPGVRLVNACHATGLKVSGIPGPSGVALALSISGIPTDSFIFEGFIPQKKGRQKKLKELAIQNRTIVLYESVYRIRKLLNELNDYMPERVVVIARELTKIYEEVLRGKPAELIEVFKTKEPKGEFVVILAPINWVES